LFQDFWDNVEKARDIAWVFGIFEAHDRFDVQYAY
jgi:hypothetical protein